MYCLNSVGFPKARELRLLPGVNGSMFPLVDGDLRLEDEVTLTFYDLDTGVKQIFSCKTAYNLIQNGEVAGASVNEKYVDVEVIKYSWYKTAEYLDFIGERGRFNKYLENVLPFHRVACIDNTGCFFYIENERRRWFIIDFLLGILQYPEDYHTRVVKVDGNYLTITSICAYDANNCMARSSWTYYIKDVAKFRGLLAACVLEGD